jgi:hypothetical protein
VHQVASGHAAAASKSAASSTDAAGAASTAAGGSTSGSSAGRGHTAGTSTGTGAGTPPGQVVGSSTSTSTSTSSTGTGSTGTASTGTSTSTSTSTGTGTVDAGSTSTGVITKTGQTTSTSTSTTQPSLHVPHSLITALPHVTNPTVTAIPSPTGTIGDPGVPCLEGYVWRQAYAGDYVCVTPVTRAQAAADNAAAVSRVQQGGGAYGQYTCQQGYVWRQVVPTDYVCVTAAVRAQAQYDNSQADNRAELLTLWVTDWTPPSTGGTTCNGDVCTSTEGGADGPNFQINGDHFNFGQVQLQIRSNAGTLLWWTNVNAGSYTGYAGDAFGAHTPFLDCSSDPSATDNDYVVAYDMTSGRWSSRLPINSDCASF